MRKKIQEKSKDGTLVKSTNGDASRAEPRKRGRWDQTVSESFVSAKGAVPPTPSSAPTPQWDREDVSIIYLKTIESN